MEAELWEEVNEDLAAFRNRLTGAQERRAYEAFAPLVEEFFSVVILEHSRGNPLVTELPMFTLKREFGYYDEWLDLRIVDPSSKYAYDTVLRVSTTFEPNNRRRPRPITLPTMTATELAWQAIEARRRDQAVLEEKTHPAPRQYPYPICALL